MEEIDKLNLSYAREYMGKVRAECLMLRSLSANASEARDRLRNVSGVRFDPMPKSPNAYGDAIPDGIAKVEALEEDCGLIDHGLVDHAEGLIRHIKDPKARVSCHLYYIEACSWGEAEKVLGYSQSSLKNFRDNGLLEIAELEPLARAPRHPAL